MEFENRTPEQREKPRAAGTRGDVLKLSDEQLEGVVGGIDQYEIGLVERDVKVMKHLGITVIQAVRSKRAAMADGRCDWTEEMVRYMWDHWSEIE